MVRKNTLPYIHQWSVLDKKTGNIISEYKTEKAAKHACKIFSQYGIPSEILAAMQLKGGGTIPNFKDTWKIAEKRMKYPNGDPPPKPPKYSNKRIVELD